VRCNAKISEQKVITDSGLTEGDTGSLIICLVLAPLYFLSFNQKRYLQRAWLERGRDSEKGERKINDNG
jgi:hypothetical protein